MDNIVLGNKWNEIVYDGNSSFDFIRIDSNCIPELCIGLNSVLNRCLILELPKENHVDFQSTVKQNLTIDFFKDTNYIVIQLTDETYIDLFNDLIISLYHKIKNINNVDEYSKEFIHTFYKWSEFFEDKKSERLSEYEIKGLFGELLVLKFLILASNSYKVNDTILAWRGPYNHEHDFVLEEKDLEIKTKDISKLDVRISSEYQLENDFKKSLELIIISVESDYIVGISIKDLVLNIKDLIIDMLGDSSLLLKALSQKNITLKNLYQYDNYKYKPINQITYNCDSYRFPKLIKSNLPKEINTLSYNIRLSSLTDFIISKTEF